MSMLAAVQAEHSGERLKLSKQRKNVDLHKLGTYYDVLGYLRHAWSDTIQLCSNRELVVPLGADIFFSNTSTSLQYIELDALRYGANTSIRGQKYCYAYVDSRRPVIIEYIFQITHPCKHPAGHVLQTTCAIIQPLLQAFTMPELPWDPWMADLGTGTWIANEFGDREVIDVYRFSGHLVLCPLPLHDQLCSTVGQAEGASVAGIAAHCPNDDGTDWDVMCALPKDGRGYVNNLLFPNHHHPLEPTAISHNYV
ncbi:hypothetical protein JB92DRAFT_3116300 [Gautieria morchelliformis]|nr:hypothetical protein JB92DRAFT_3116300 [Gautieria morchelliformis]